MTVMGFILGRNLIHGQISLVDVCESCLDARKADLKSGRMNSWAELRRERADLRSGMVPKKSC